MQSTIVPLVKCKGGDITDINNYRAIALSNSLSKILETLFLSKVNSTDLCDKYQFGFKADHPTGLCTNAMKSVVEIKQDKEVMYFCVLLIFLKILTR